MLKFRVVKSKAEMKEEGFYLIPDSWDDWFEYEIAYWLWIYKDSPRYISRVKIAEVDQKTRKTILETEFTKLKDNYVSIGFSDDYYEELNRTPYRKDILNALNDIAYDLERYERIKTHNVTLTSLMREYTTIKLKGQVHRMAHGGSRLTDYNFDYVLPSIDPNTGEKARMSFEVKKEKKPFSNIHVMIGKNGVGKTTVIKNIIYALEKAKPAETVGEVEKSWGENFSNIVFISFSAFDNPIFEDEIQEEGTIKYKFVGLVKKGSIKRISSLAEEFIDSSFNFYKNSSKMRLWKETIKILESDNTFLEQGIGEWIDESIKKEWLSEVKVKISDYKSLDAREKYQLLKEKHKERLFDKFQKLSSGHKIILLTIANLIDLVEEKTIVLMDEPEEHLHPPLVAAFMRALSNLLIYRNGVGIIATHSPVIVQEVPKKCVWILRRHGEYLVPVRPELETYGENLGELTTEIFRYEVINSGFHKELKDAVEKCDSYDEAKEVFQNQLGKEAKSILRAYMYDKEKN